MHDTFVFMCIYNNDTYIGVLTWKQI